MLVDNAINFLSPHPVPVTKMSSKPGVIRPRPRAHERKQTTDSRSETRTSPVQTAQKSSEKLSENHQEPFAFRLKMQFGYKYKRCKKYLKCYLKQTEKRSEKRGKSRMYAEKLKNVSCEYNRLNG